MVPQNKSNFRRGPKVVSAVFSPAKKKTSVLKKQPDPSDAASVKYHFCFSSVDLKKSKKMYSLIDSAFGDYDFSTNVLRLGADHYLSMYMDEEKLIHIDFIGDEWTCAETDAVFDRLRSVFRANNLFFAFTNWKESQKDS